MTKITGKFDWQNQREVPAFVQGEDALAVYNAIKDSGLGWMDYDEKTRTLRGDNPFIAARIDTILRPLGIRVATLRDLSNPEIINMVGDRFYSDTPAFVLRSRTDSYRPNLAIIAQLAEAIERKNGRADLPCMVSGFDVKPAESREGYGLFVVPRDDFQVVCDERLKGENDGKRFSEVDEIGLPKFDKDGTRAWYARRGGLSGLFLDRNLYVYSNIEYLAYSIDIARVVVVSGGATSQKS